MCPWTIINGLILFLIVDAVIIAFVLYWQKMRSNASLIESLGGRPTGGFGGVFTVDGFTVTSAYHPGSRKKPSSFRIALQGDFRASFIIRREGAVDVFAKNIGLNVEVQTEDPAFDREYYIECDDQALMTELLGLPEVKRAVRGLLLMFSRVEVQGSQCFAVCSPCPDINRIQSSAVDQAARALVVLARHLPPVVSGRTSLTPLTDEFNRSQRFFWWVSGALLAAGFVLFVLLWQYEPLEKMKVFKASLFFSVPLLGMFVLYAFHELKGHAASARVFIPVAVLAVTGLLLSAWSGGIVFNGVMDVSVPVMHQASVGMKHEKHGKRTTYHITILGWDQRSDGFSFPVSYQDYVRIQVGDPCVIKTRAGLLGFEWVSGKYCGR